MGRWIRRFFLHWKIPDEFSLPSINIYAILSMLSIHLAPFFEHRCQPFSHDRTSRLVFVSSSCKTNDITSLLSLSVSLSSGKEDVPTFHVQSRFSCPRISPLTLSHDTFLTSYSISLQCSLHQWSTSWFQKKQKYVIYRGFKSVFFNL